MKDACDTGAKKRPVNLTLNDELVNQARSITDNLSGVVETLLADFVKKAHAERLRKSKVVESTMAAWNEFNAKSGSIADEYSSL